MSDEPIPKADKDYTKEVDKQLPEAEALAKVWDSSVMIVSLRPG